MTIGICSELNELNDRGVVHVFNCAGLRGTPNADWCEDHSIEVTRSNILGALNVADCCYLLGIHLTYFGSGCIYDQDADHPLDGTGFTEEEPPFYGGSMYSRSRLYAENVDNPYFSYPFFHMMYNADSRRLGMSIQVMRVYPNVLILRLRGPMAADLHPKNLLTRLMKYERLINIPSSVSVLSNLLPGAVLMASHGVTGVFNLVNPGPCTNNDIMERAREHIRPGLAWENFAVADMNRVLRAPRANVTLDAGKLVRQCRELGYQIKTSHEALDDMFLEMKKKGL